MNSEDHIHFLSDLLQHVNELTALIREYCDEVMRDEDTEDYQAEMNKHKKLPF